MGHGVRLTTKERRAAQEAQAAPAYLAVPGPSVPHPRTRIPAHISSRPDVYLPNGWTLMQPRLPPLLSRGPLPRAAQDQDAYDNRDMHRRKRGAQWRRWQLEVIPTVLPHFTRVLHATKSLRDCTDLPLPTASSGSCACKTSRVCKIAIVRFSSCQRRATQDMLMLPAAVQLIQCGTFPCAPLAPTLAVDLRVLEFAMNLFLQIAPNNTAFSTTLERCLGAIGFQLQHQNSLHRRFGNCLMWYIHLRTEMKMYHQNQPRLGTQLLSRVRPCILPLPDHASSPTPAARGRQAQREPRPQRSSSTTPTPESPQQQRKQQRETTPEAPPLPFPEPPPRTRPSEYLQRCCPACFGNLKHDPSLINYSADVLPCIDACFTQKRAKAKGQGGRDPPRTHPHTHFVDEDDAARTEAYVDGVRDEQAKRDKQAKRHKAMRDALEEEDGYEHPLLRLPRSVMDGCEASFKAADEKREKASTAFFEDTAIMGLLCRHDRVLWLVNMHSAGEKQFNVVVLLETLFQELPSDIRVGLLYDVACTFKRSCRKWGFLSRFMDRLAFAVSVFHAFGHEWACQLLYHPRKRVGFGFTNGEGCERFWHSISHLIANLRICGVIGSAAVICIVFRNAETAEEALRECGKPMAVLRAQWDFQVKAQTKPLPRRSKTKGQQAVNSVLIMRSALKTRSIELRKLRDTYLDAVMDEDRDAGLHQVAFKTAEEAMKAAERKLQREGSSLRESAVKRREPTISKVNTEYNRLCGEISKLIKEGKAPRGAVAPVPIPAKDEDDRESMPLPWLCDERVRAGIKAMLEVDRCDEEDKRLKKERCSLQVWFAEEWDVVNLAIAQADSLEDEYHLKLRRDDLVRLCATWERRLPDLGMDETALPPWGPSAGQLAACVVDAHVAARGEDRHYDDDEDNNENNSAGEESGHEEEDFGTLDAVETADIYRNAHDDNYYVY
ncbi:hypothetical protein FB451DRAFT_1195879 [Mycena latifolia]|nr:hypothetical protein FB451DRAFT_1195879 [Mycena latifolia]